MQKILAFLFLLIFPSWTLAALTVDDFEANRTADMLSGDWGVYTDGQSIGRFNPSETQGVDAQDRAGVFQWELKPGAKNLYVVLQGLLRHDGRAVELSKYQGIRLYLRGHGNLILYLATDDTRKEYNHYYYPIELTADRKCYEIPFKLFDQTFGKRTPFNPAKVFAIGFNAGGIAGTKGEAAIDHIEFYLPSEATQSTNPNPVLNTPKADQVGYLPDGEKSFWISEPYGKVNDNFYILDASEAKVYTGHLQPAVDDRVTTGEVVLKGDFTDFSKPGRYVVAVGDHRSYPFVIESKAFLPVYRDALRAFYLIRCGIAIDDPVTGLHHPPCHTKDGQLRDQPGRSIDAVGGWHNAGDLGKWTHMDAICVSYFMWLYELKKGNVADIKTNTPESADGQSDLLHETEWGLNWLFKLQRPDGSVYHKVDTEPEFCYGTPPDQDPFPRYVALQGIKDKLEPSSIDAAAFTAVMAQAARVFAGSDPAYADRCRAAALKSWHWLAGHQNIGQSDPYYVDPNPTPYVFWARAEMARLTGDAKLAAECEKAFQTIPYRDFHWLDPSAFGYFTLYFDPKSDARLKRTIRTAVEKYSDRICDLSDAKGYGVALNPDEYYWESNECLMHRANCLLFASVMTGKDRYRQVAIRQLDYILGKNSLERSFVTGHGANPTAHPFHWAYGDYGVVIPGWATGGPNGMQGLFLSIDSPLQTLIKLGTPPAKCYLDMGGTYGSWGSNEGETSENAALVFLTGFLIE